MTDTETILIDDVENKRIDVYPSEEHLSCERANAVDRSMSLFQALTSHQGQRISTPTDDAIRPRSTGKSRKKEISLTTFLLLSIFGRRRRSAWTDRRFARPVRRRDDAILRTKLYHRRRRTIASRWRLRDHSEDSK